MIWNITREKTATAVKPRVGLSDWDERFALGEKQGREETAASFAGLNPREVRAKLRGLRKEINQNDRTMSGYKDGYDRLTKMVVAADDLAAWSESFLTFQKPRAPLFAELRQAIYDGSILDMNDYQARTPADDYERELFADANVFVIEHDWWSAVKRADDFEGGSFRLPFDICIFEFVISGKSVIALAVNYGELEDNPSKNEILMQVATKSLVGWTLSGAIYSHAGGAWTNYGRTHFSGGTQSGPVPAKGHNLIRLVGDQIKAACVALEAEIAIANITRLPASGKTSEPTQFPPVEYRAISLRRRPRPPELPGGDGRKGRRLHFRRGHWRHMPTFKTWVRWTMVGDPDLGFIEKEYRL